MTAQLMPRKNRTFRLDERLLDGLSALAKKKNMSANKYLENWLLATCVKEGVLPPDTEPLGEQRGGDRTQTKQEEK